MAFSLNDIRKGGELKAPRILLLGVEKIGKTTFACGSHFVNGKLVQIGANKPIVASIRGEEGADGLGVPIFPICNTVDDVLDTISCLYTEEHSYQTYVLDSASALSPIVNDYICNAYEVENIRKVPGFRVGDAAIVNKWREILHGITSLRDDRGMASIIIGHTKVKKAQNTEGDSWDTWDLDLEFSEVTEQIKRWADVILFANNKVVVKKDGEDKGIIKAKRRGIDTTEGKRFLFTQKRPGHPGGGRNVYGKLPYELPLDWVEFEAAVAIAASAETNNTTQEEEE